MIAAYILYIILAIGLVAFFAGGETAFTSIKFMKLMHLIEKKDKAALLVHNILKRPDRLLITTLVGTNIAVVIASSLATHLFIRLNPDYASIMTTFIMVPFVLIFGEIIPKTICQNKSNQVSLKIAPLILFSQKIFLPINVVVGLITTSLLNIIGPRTIKKNPFLTKDEIKLIIRDVTKEGIIEDYERDVIDRIFDFTLTKAADIMVPIKDVICAQSSQSKQEILDKAGKYGFTRLPVFEDKNIKGVINIFDIFYNSSDKDWHEFIRPLSKISFDERLDGVFSMMQPNKEVMAAVVKNNIPVGMLTMEDLIEEIVYSTKK
ncbi:MAG: CNNM domain-containing protein [Candidatus Omnitrophica bacterium]|nr:CNNM domain-containing protein [Candidatus Omnitrophota bacterium]